MKSCYLCGNLINTKHKSRVKCVCGATYRVLRNVKIINPKQRKDIVKTHYLPMYKPHPTTPTIIGYNVWAYIGHPLLGEIKESFCFVKTKPEAQRLAAKMRKQYNR